MQESSPGEAGSFIEVKSQGGAEWQRNTGEVIAREKEAALLTAILRRSAGGRK